MTNLNNIEGLRKNTLQQNNGAQEGIKYDKNEIQEAMQKENSVFDVIDNDNGYFVTVFDEETGVEHMLCDRDKDGIFDDYRRSEYQEDGSWKAYDDDNFDGVFDHTTTFTPTGNGLIAACDNNADGEIDYYIHHEPKT